MRCLIQGLDVSIVYEMYEVSGCMFQQCTRCLIQLLDVSIMYEVSDFSGWMCQ
ncbi:hypothetical protein DPMN_054379 [Dreissena polymorpha]|uniref:Uncharacterized protein n=1 Tax=Dreissena polymorpha TaxID=45954 RepID=A0A9D4CQ83_DREPO|nr:hypothetical protein DPMN_054379 [Dreissena polymorpha]